MKQDFKSISDKVKALSHRKQQWKEALIFFCFLLLATGFWMLQSLQQEYDINIRIPVNYKNLPKDIAFSETPPDYIDVKIKDKGTVLLNYKFGRTFAAIDVSVKNETNKQNQLLIDKKEIESDVRKQLMATTSIIAFEPQQNAIKFSQRIGKKVSVRFDGDIRTAPGFKVYAPVSIQPEIITAYASHYILDTLVSASTVYTEYKRLDKSLTQTIQIQPVDGVTFEPSSVTVSIPIEEFTEKTLEIPVNCVHIPPYYRVRIFPSSVKVSCSVPLSAFKNITEDLFAIDIPYQEFEQNASGKIMVQLTKKPDEIDKITISPDQIEFIIEHIKNHD